MLDLDALETLDRAFSDLPDLDAVVETTRRTDQSGMAAAPQCPHLARIAAE